MALTGVQSPLPALSAPYTRSHDHTGTNPAGGARHPPDTRKAAARLQATAASRFARVRLRVSAYRRHAVRSCTRGVSTGSASSESPSFRRCSSPARALIWILTRSAAARVRCGAAQGRRQGAAPPRARARAIVRAGGRTKPLHLWQWQLPLLNGAPSRRGAVRSRRGRTGPRSRRRSACSAAELFWKQLSARD